MPLRHLTVACLLALALAGCSDDEDEPAPDSAPSSHPEANPDATLPSAVARVVTAGRLEEVCPDGHFTETDDVLGTLPREYAAQADELLTYDCDDVADQVVWAAMPSADLAAEAAENADGAPTFVAASTVLVVSPRLVEEVDLDVDAYFAALAKACGCGSDIRSGP